MELARLEPATSWVRPRRGDYTTLGPDPRRATILPVQFDDLQPERIGTARRHPCELSVHPEERLPAAAGSAPEGEPPMGPDPHSSRFRADQT